MIPRTEHHQRLFWRGAKAAAIFALALAAFALFAPEREANAAGSFWVPFKTNNWTVTGGWACSDPARPWTSHCAWDLSAPSNTSSGTQVAAAASGTAYVHTDGFFTEDNRCLRGESWGRWIEVRHDNGLRTYYAHLKSFAAGINGRRVNVGQVIGIMGNSGCATGPHLHFEVHNTAGRAVNPGNPRSCNLSTAQWTSCPARIYTRQPAPSVRVVVDDTSSRFSRFGPAQYWLQYANGYGRHMFATWNNGPCSYGAGVCPQGRDVNYAIWRPSLPSTGNWRVCAYIPEDHAYTRSARYKVAHTGGTTTVTVNQQPLVGWVSLGVFRFIAGTSGYVRLGDWTGEAFASRQMGFDAVEWVANGGTC
jgi:hypothetical protein